MTALSSYIVPYNKTLSALVVTEFIIVTVGSFVSLTWAFLGVRIQRLYERHYKNINWLLGVYLVYCAASMALC